jgi:hypothetical protein
VQYAATGATDEKHIKTLTRAAKLYPYDDITRPQVEQELRDLLDGYVATADPPLSVLSSELLRLYPNAKVIVTVRDREPWTVSMLKVIKTSQPRLAGLLFFWIPSVRWLPRFADAVGNVFTTKFGVEMHDAEDCVVTWDRHIEQLERIVPKEQLFYFNVKEGWEPLCKVSTPRLLVYCMW